MQNKKIVSGTLVLVASLTLVVQAALGQAPNPQPASPTKTPPPDTLAGPKVSETQTQRSLAKRNFQGRVQRLEMNPDEAAIELLAVDGATKAKIDTILQERAAILDRVVRQNVDLLLKFQQTGDRRARLALFGEFRAKLKDLEARGRLRDEIMRVLSKDQQDRYRDLIEGYWTVLVDDAMQEAKNASKPDNKGDKGKAKIDEPTRAEVLAREVLLAIGQEIKRSYERQAAGRLKQLEEFLGKLQLSEEKETRLRTMFVDFAQKYPNGANEQQRRDVFQRVYKELDKDQQKIALDELFGRGGGEPTEKQPAPGDAMMPEESKPETGKK